MDKKYLFADLCGIMDALLGENGCPWDKAQTHESLLPHLVEESYEVIDAVNRASFTDLCEELGDVMLQVVIHAKIAEKEGEFTIDDVTDAVSRKMIHRHPHVFGDTVVSDADHVLDNWERIKTDEKGFSSHAEALRAVPAALPGLIRAEKIVKRAEKARLPERDMGPEFESAEKGLDELADAARRLSELQKAGQGLSETDIGGLILLIVTISRKLRINTEFALTNALEQFINRFEHMEKQAQSGFQN